MVADGMATPTVHPVNGDLLHAEYAGTPSLVVARQAPSGAVRVCAANSGVGGRPTRVSSFIVRVTIVSVRSESVTTPPGGTFWRRRMSPNSRARIRAPSTKVIVPARTTGTPTETTQLSRSAASVSYTHLTLPTNREV